MPQGVYNLLNRSLCPCVTGIYTGRSSLYSPETTLLVQPVAINFFKRKLHPFVSNTPELLLVFARSFFSFRSPASRLTVAKTAACTQLHPSPVTPGSRYQSANVCATIASHKAACKRELGRLNDAAAVTPAQMLTIPVAITSFESEETTENCHSAYES